MEYIGRIPNFVEKVMADIDNNLPISVDGGEQALLGTDVYNYNGATAHAQVMKVAWGSETTVTRVTQNTPFPVQVFGITGNTSRITVTGSVSGLGVFTIGNTSGGPVYVTGAVNSFVYGVTGAAPVAVTGGVRILGDVGITGQVNVTGGRYLNPVNDIVSVTGSVGRSWNLTNANDNIRIYGHNGSTGIPVNLFSSNNVGIGSSGDALNVNVIGASINATVTVGATVGVDNASGSVLRVQGTANGTPIPVSFSTTPTINVENTSTNPVFVDYIPSSISYNQSNQNATLLNNLEKMLVAGEYEGSTKFLTATQFIRSLAAVAGAFGGNNSIYKRLENIESGTSSIKVKTSLNFISNPSIYVFTLIANSTRITIPYFLTNIVVSSIQTNNGFLYCNKSSQPIYLTSSNHVNSVLGAGCAFGTCPDGVSVSNPGVAAEFTVALSSTTIITNLKNGSYVIPANSSAILPVLFDRAFTDGSTNATLNITPV